MSDSGEEASKRITKREGNMIHTKNDPYEEMVTYITGKQKHERLSKERAIRFPTKVRKEEFVLTGQRRSKFLLPKDHTLTYFFL